LQYSDLPLEVIGLLGDVIVLVMSTAFPVFLSRTFCVIAVNAITFRLDRVTASSAGHVPPRPPHSKHPHCRLISVDLIALNAAKILYARKRHNCIHCVLKKSS
jgi:hypothetical protein